MCMVSHLTSYCISSVVSDLPVKSINSMADHNCVAYSNTVEIFFTQQDQLQTVKSSCHDYITIVLHYYSGYLDQSAGSCVVNKSGPQVVL